VILTVTIDNAIAISSIAAYFRDKNQLPYQSQHTKKQKVFLVKPGVGHEVAGKKQPMRCLIVATPRDPSRPITVTCELKGVLKPAYIPPQEADRVSENMRVFDQDFWFNA